MPENSPYDEKELLIKISEGDEVAFSTIFNNFFPSLMFFCQRFVSFEVAQEIISDVFCKYWKNKILFFSEAQLYQWFKIAVRNAALNQIKADNRSYARQEDMHILSDNQYESIFFEAGIEAELYEKIITSIEELPDQQRKIVKMFFLEGMDNSSIAQKLNISVQAVKNQKVTALKSLRKILTTNDLLFVLTLAKTIF